MVAATSTLVPQPCKSLGIPRASGYWFKMSGSSSQWCLQESTYLWFPRPVPQESTQPFPLCLWNLPPSLPPSIPFPVSYYSGFDPEFLR